MNNLQITTLSDLKGQGIKIARFASNRDIDEKAVKAKKKSLERFGMLVPAIGIAGEKALSEGMEIVDFGTGKLIESEDAEKYIVLVDANHRYQAHLELLKENPDYKHDFYIISPLNQTVRIGEMLAEINISTNPWKGGDFGKGASMLCNEKLPLLDAINELTSKGYSLTSASKWNTFSSSITKAMLTDAMAGKIHDELRKTNGLERGKRLLTAARKCFDEKNLKTRTIVDWVKSKYDNATDEQKANVINQIVGMFELLSREQVKPIEEAKGVRGVTTKESVIYEIMNNLFDKYVESVENVG